MPEHQGAQPARSAREGSRRPKQLHRRVKIRLPIRVSTIDPETDPETGKSFFRTAEEQCLDLSRGGVLVRTPEAIEPGRRVLVEVDLPDGSSLQTLGQVVWRRTRLGGGMGVRFASGGPDRFVELERFLEKNLGRRSRSAASRITSPLLG